MPRPIHDPYLCLGFVSDLPEWIRESLDHWLPWQHSLIWAASGASVASLVNAEADVVITDNEELAAETANRKDAILVFIWNTDCLPPFDLECVRHRVIIGMPERPEDLYFEVGAAFAAPGL